MAAPVSPLFVSPVDAAKLAGVSRSRIYELIGAGVLTRRKDGARTLIRVAEVLAWLESLPVDFPDDRRTDPLLPIERQRLAVERATDPPKLKSKTKIARARPCAVQDAPNLNSAPKPPPVAQPAVEPAPDLAAIYAERFKLIVGNLGPDEAHLRAKEKV